MFYVYIPLNLYLFFVFIFYSNNLNFWISNTTNIDSIDQLRCIYLTEEELYETANTGDQEYYDHFQVKNKLG